MDRTFRDRREAGRVLAEMLADRCAGADVVVLGLARGGVPVGLEIAVRLGAPLDAFVVRKLGVPQWPELAMGAIASGGGVVVNEQVMRSLQHHRQPTSGRHRRRDRASSTDARRPTAVLLPRPRLAARTVVLADDGIATGATMLAAVRAVRATGPARVIVAVPVGPTSVYERLRGEADDVVIAATPRRFEAVGQVFADFRQVSDDRGARPH